MKRKKVRGSDIHRSKMSFKNKGLFFLNLSTSDISTPRKHTSSTKGPAASQSIENCSVCQSYASNRLVIQLKKCHLRILLPHYWMPGCRRQSFTKTTMIPGTFKSWGHPEFVTPSSEQIGCYYMKKHWYWYRIGVLCSLSKCKRKFYPKIIMAAKKPWRTSNFTVSSASMGNVGLHTCHLVQMYHN